MRAPSFRGRISGYKHVRRALRTVKECCLHRARQPAPYIPKTSAGRFRPNLPITDRPRQPLDIHEGLVSRFRMPNVWHQNGFVVFAASTAPLSPRQSWPYLGPFWAVSSLQSDNSGRQPASLATHRAGRAYYIYVASQNDKQGILTGNPKGSFGRPISAASDSAIQNRNRQQRSGGDRANQANSLICPFGRASIVARQAR